MLVAILVVLGLLVLAAAPFLLLTPRAPKPPAGVETVAALEAYLSLLTANGTPPAVDVTVMRDGAVVYARAFGTADGPRGVPAPPYGVYHFWSVTKLFTATAIMQLADDGEVALDDPVTRYLPEFETSFGGKPAQVTIRQLLDHTSGMKNLGPGDLLGWIHHIGDPPVSQTLLVRERMQAYRALAAEPGKTGAYSNAGYIVLGAIVEAASGMTFEDFVRARILKPLGMACSDFVYRGDMLPRAVTGSHPLFHIYTPLLLAIHHDWFSAWVARTMAGRTWLKPLTTDYTGPTGLIGTGRDLARFGEACLSGGALGGQRILSPETAAAMLDSGYGGSTGPDGDRMGLGWHWFDRAAIPFKGHGGDGPGFGAQLALFPDRHMVVVVLANDTLIDRVGLTELVASVFRR